MLNDFGCYYYYYYDYYYYESFVNHFFHTIFMNFSRMDELKKAKGCMCWPSVPSGGQSLQPFTLSGFIQSRENDTLNTY
jgi:hypothetical protein